MTSTRAEAARSHFHIESTSPLGDWWTRCICIRILWLTMAVVLLFPFSGVFAEDSTILFVDDDAILYRSGTERHLQLPRRFAGGPIIAETKPWELAIGYCTVIRDPHSGQYQAWYQSYAGPRSDDRTRRVVLCYATSDDGISWRKPELDLFDFNGDRKTNIVLVGNGGRSVNYGASVLYDDSDPDPSRRYKLAYWDFVKHQGRETPGLCVAFSKDGIHWNKHVAPPLLQGAYGEPGSPPLSTEAHNLPQKRPAISDVLDVMYDPKRARYVLYSKTWIDGPRGNRFWKRAVVRSESSNFLQWTDPQVVMTPDDQDAGQLHGAPVFYHHGIYFALVQRLDFGGFDRGGTGNMPSELAISRDGVRWKRRFSNQMFLPVSGDGATFDAGCLWTNASPVILEDEIRFYYGAYPGWNADVEQSGSGIGFFWLKKDRFAGIEAKGEGQITLRRVRLDGQKLSLNCAAAQGEIRVELLDERGYRVPGFSRESAIPLSRDGLEEGVKWQTFGREIPAGRYQIRIHLRNATVFALSIRP